MKALALVDTPGHVCCRYRIRAFEPALTRAGVSLETLGIARGAVGRVAQLAGLPRYDAIILQRKLLPPWHLALLRRKTDRLVFDFDDAVLYRDSYDPRGPYSSRRAARFAAIVNAADGVIAGNDFLADCALRAGARPENVRVIPTCVAIEYYPPRRPVGRDKATRLDLVWIGSSSTLRGLEARRALWERIAAEVPGVRMRVVCDRFPRFGSLPVVDVPWSEPTEAAALAEGDVGFSWIPDDDWSRGKCGLKVVQYQAAGLPVVANPVGVHPEMVRPGETGWLPADDDQWVDAVRALADDPSSRERMGRTARAAVEANYSVAAWESTFVAAAAGAAGFTPPVGRPTALGRTREAAGRGPIGAAG